MYMDKPHHLKTNVKIYLKKNPKVSPLAPAATAAKVGPKEASILPWNQDSDRSSQL